MIYQMIMFRSNHEVMNGYKKTIQKIKKAALSFYKEYPLDIEHHLNRLRVTKRDPNKLSPVIRCSLINNKKVGATTKQKIMEYIRDRLDDERSLLTVARLDIHTISHSKWTIIEWYFNPSASTKCRNVLAKNLIKAFRLAKRAPDYASSTFVLDSFTIFSKNKKNNHLHL
jgi:hypothetical protein